MVENETSDEKRTTTEIECFEIHGDRLLVRIERTPNQDHFGLGIVVVSGPELWFGFHGRRVAYFRHAGIDIEFDGIPHVVLNYNDVIGSWPAPPESLEEKSAKTEMPHEKDKDHGELG